MGSEQHFVDEIVNQLKPHIEIVAKKMFGEYGLYTRGKLFGLICDNKIFIKPTPAGRAFIGQVVEAAPYEGAKPSFLVGEVDAPSWLTELIECTLPELPEPKKRKR